jgi:hypothetical protein
LSHCGFGQTQDATNPIVIWKEMKNGFFPTYPEVDIDCEMHNGEEAQATALQVKHPVRWGSVDLQQQQQT